MVLFVVVVIVLAVVAAVCVVGRWEVVADDAVPAAVDLGPAEGQISVVYAAG